MKILLRIMPALCLSLFAVSAFATNFDSPTPKIGSLYEFLVEILKIVIKISIPVLTMFYLFIGFMFVTAQGDPTKLKAARSWFTWAVVGTALVLGGVVIATIIQNTIGQLGG